MNLIELVEQAKAKVRIYECGHLVATVDVAYPEVVTGVGACLEVCYPVGAEHNVLVEYSSAVPYHFQSPSGSSADVCSATTQHERRAF